MLASWATIKKRKNRHGQVERAKVEVMTRVIRNHACLSHSNHMIGTSYKQHLIRICFRYGLKWCLCPHLCCTVGMAYGFEWMWVCVCVCFVLCSKLKHVDLFTQFRKWVCDKIVVVYYVFARFFFVRCARRYAVCVCETMVSGGQLRKRKGRREIEWKEQHHIHFMLSV